MGQTIPGLVAFETDRVFNASISAVYRAFTDHPEPAASSTEQHWTDFLQVLKEVME